MATKIRASNLHTDVKTMVTTMVGENALDSAEANLLIDSKFTAKNTDNLSEGSSNLYFTNARADARAQLKVDAIVGSAPGTLDTLQELGDALGDDPNFATTVTNSIATKLPLVGGTLTGNLSLTSTASGSSASPELELRRDITGADANYLGQIKFTADNDADQNIVFAKITGKILDASDGTEDGIIEFAHKKAGSNNISARFRSDSLQLINGTNLTVAGTTDLTGNLTVDTNTLYVDTSNNRVGIGTSSPSRQLDIYDDGTVGQAVLALTAQNTDYSRIMFADPDDSNIGILDYAHSDNSMRFFVNNDERMRIDASGNVGIGRTPVNTLSPSLEMVSGGSLFGYGDALYLASNLYYASGWKAMATGGGAKYVSDSNGHRFYTNASASAGAAATPVERLRIDSSGKVGIGNNSPSSMYSTTNNLVIGDSGNSGITIKSTGGIGAISFADGVNGSERYRGQIAYSHSGDSLRFNTAAGERMRIDSSGNLLKRNNGNIEVGGYGNGTDYGVILTPADGGGYYHMYNDAGGHLAFGRGNTLGSSESMRIDSSGKVGIGTATPSSELHIEKAITGDNSQLRISNGAGATLRIGITGNDTNEHAHIKTNSAENLEFHIGQAANSTSPNVVFKSGGNVGIGDATPTNGYLTIRGASTSGTANSHIMLTGDGATVGEGPQIAFSESGVASNWVGASIGFERTGGGGIGNLIFSTRRSTGDANTLATEAMRIDSSGKVGIGTSNPGNKLSVDNGTSDGGIFKLNNEEVGLHVSVNGSVGDYTNSTRMVVFNATRFDSGTAPKLRLGGQGGLEFAVDANNVRMTIDSSGSVLVAKNSVNIGTAGHTFGASGYQHSTRNGNLIHLNQLDADGNAIIFMQAGATKGSVFVNSTGSQYNTTSDRRLKDNIQPISDATDKLMNMKPVTHTWIDNPDEPQVHGFIAQEMQEVVPEAVTGDAESDEMMSMDYGRITPVIVAALQDALNEIKELKTRINELENK